MSNSNYYSNKQQTSINYRRKLKRLKKCIKDMVIENAALCDQVAQVQENILIVKEERRFLLKKLYLFEPHSDLEIQINKNSFANASSSSHGEHKKNRKRPHSDSHDHHNHKPAKSRKPASRPRKKLVQQIPLDSTGRPVFPIELGILTVHSLGEIITDRYEFHTDDAIYPVGYVSTRVYGSLTNPRLRCVYTCKISDNNGVPRFDITADNELGTPIIGASPDICHSLLLRHINSSLNDSSLNLNSDSLNLNNPFQMDVVNTHPRGNDFFGLSHPTILNLIQSSPGARKCGNYKWNKFEVGRNVDPIEEHDPSLNFEALQRSISFSSYKTVPEIKEEPPDDIMDNSTGTLRDLLMS